MSWNVRLGWMLSPIISESGGRWCIAHLRTPALGKEQLCNHQPASRLRSEFARAMWMKLTVRVVCRGAFQLSCFFTQTVNHLKLDSNTQFLETKYIKKRQLTWFCWTTTDESDLQPPNWWEDMYQLTWRLAGFVLQLDAKIPGFSGKAQARAWFQAEFSWKKPRLVLLGLPASDLARLNEKVWEGWSSQMSLCFIISSQKDRWRVKHIGRISFTSRTFLPNVGFQESSC